MEDVDTLYARWLAGEISPEEEKALKASGEWAELEALVKAMEGMVLPPYRIEEAYDRLRFQRGKTHNAQTSRRFLWVGALAAAACLALLIYFSWNSSSSLVKHAAALASNAEGNLPDGSRFVLNDGSSLQYLEANWQAQRVLTLKGEAFFQVLTGNTFEVITPNGKVEVVGTQFNVRAWGNVLTVECYEGKVSVSQGSDQSLIEAGQRIKVDQGNMGEIQAISLDRPAWIEGFSTFEDEALEAVFEEIARQYAVTFEKSVLNRSFSGSFPHSDLEEALRQVCKPMGLSYRISDDKQIVTILE